MRTQIHRTSLFVAAFSVMAMTLAPVVAVVAAEPEIPAQTREGLEWALRDLVEILIADKDDNGWTYRRGTSSKNFERVDDDTYRVTWHEDTASEDRLKTERYTLALTRKSGTDHWEISERKLEDTLKDVIRLVPGDETFYRFETFAFNHEGIEVEITDGSAFVDYLDGKASSIQLASDDIEWRYAPPEHATPYCHQIHDYLSETEPEDFVFDAERVVLVCTQERCDEILDGAFVGRREVEKDDIHPRLRSSYEDRRKEQVENRKENGFSGFRAPPEPDRDQVYVAVKRKSPIDHWFWLDDDNWDGWEVHAGASRYGQVLAHHRQETSAGAQSAALERRDDASQRYYDVVGVKGAVDLALIEADTMTGDVTISLKAKRDIEHVPFSISRLREGGGIKQQFKDPSLVINSIRDESGNELTWVKLGSTRGLVALREPVKAGATFSLRVRYENDGAVYKLFPSYSRLARGGWLPFVGIGEMIAEFDLTVRVPAKFTTLGVGTKVMEKTEGDVHISRWTSEFPVSFPTVIFGDYIEAEPSFEAKKTDGTKIPVVIHADKHGMMAWNIRAKQLGALAEAAVNSLNLYREVYGVDYPFGKLDLVNDPMGPAFYGQSPASIVYLGSAVFRGSGAVADGSLSKFNDSVVAHEVAHQWWGGLVTNANRRNYWFVESLAEYSAAMFIEALRGRKDSEKGWQAYVEHVEDWRHEILESGMWGSVQAADDLNVGGRTAAIYNKGPYAFHMLRMTFGTEKLNNFLRMLATELAGQEIVTQDIQNVAEQAFGGTMEWFFDQWIRGAGIPEYSMNYRTHRTEDGHYVVQGEIGQQVVMGEEEYVVPNTYFRGVGAITVTGRETGKEYPVRVLIEGEKTPFLFKVPEEPLEVTLNKYGEILSLDVNAPE
jgi:hypothetical protein